MLSATCSSSSFGFGNSIMIFKPSNLHTANQGLQPRQVLMCSQSDDQGHLDGACCKEGKLYNGMPHRASHNIKQKRKDLYLGCGAPLSSSFVTPWHAPSMMRSLASGFRARAACLYFGCSYSQNNSPQQQQCKPMYVLWLTTLKPHSTVSCWSTLCIV